MSYSSIRKILRKVILDILSVYSNPRNGVHILNGHFLSLNSNTGNVIFKKQLEDLSQKGVSFIDIDKAVKMISEKNVNHDKCYVAFTFDDGFEECYTKIRPVLNELGLKAGFFVNPNFIDGDNSYKENFKRNVVFTDKQPMSWEQIKELLTEGHVIGAHTMDHYKLDTTDIDILEYQIGNGKKYLEEKLEYHCDYFAFPYGQLKHISELGISVASNHFKYIFSQSNYKAYFSFNGKVINRRHFECDWPYKHVIYFLKRKTIK